MKKLLTTLTAVALFGAATASFARPGGGLMRMDADGDGQISREEFQPPEHREGPGGPFGRADADDDGIVTRSEVQIAGAEHQERMLAMFDSIDANGDGTVTPDEAQDHMFAKLDADGDGFITKEEARAMHRERGERRGKGRDDGEDS